MDFSSNTIQTQKPTIVHILWDGDFGGIQRIVKNVFLDDTASKFRHVVVLAGHFGPLIGPAPDRFCLGMKNGFDIYAFLKLRKILKKIPDSIFVYHLDTPIFRLLFNNKYGPMVYLEHGCTVKRDKFRIINKFLGERFFGHCDKIVCISKQIQGAIVSLYPHYAPKTLVISNPVTIPFSKPRVKNYDPATVGFIGRFSPEKGPKDFIRCAQHLSKSFPLVKFRMIGDGPLLQECKDMANRDEIPIEFMGAIKDVSGELASIDIVAISSLKDAFNMVVVEAMASGAPVVAYPVGGIPEIITHNVTGLLCEAANPESLADSVQRILTEKELYAKISANAYFHARENYGLEAYQKEWDDIFNSVISSFSKTEGVS
jgi:glycosyltransferase involved in cell wall biosynthesis